MTMKSSWGAVATAAAACLCMSYANSINSIVDANSISNGLVPRDAGTFEVPLITRQLPAGLVPLVNVSFGTPPQTVSVLADSGSASLWIPDLTSPACQLPINESLCSQSATNSPFYLGGMDPNKSSTLQPLTNMSTFKVKYGDNSTEDGSYFSDTVAFGQTSFKDIGFALVTNASTPYPNYGVWGIAGPRDQQSYPPTISKFVEQGATLCNS